MIRLLLIFLSFSAHAYDFDTIQENRDFESYRYEEQRRFEIEQDREDRRERYIRNERLNDQWDRTWEESHDSYQD